MYITSTFWDDDLKSAEVTKKRNSLLQLNTPAQ